jgi:hypothetical protein
MTTVKDPTSTSCPDCAIGPFSKLNPFDGMFMTAADFIAEQRYHVDKLRHHHQRLHGSGVVCGLEVTPHPNSECQNRYVYVGPGTAIDCCGREIVVRESTLIDLWQFKALTDLRDKPDGKDHVLQLCLRYAECPTDEVPVLFDDCGCDDTNCMPSRILESFKVDVTLDPPVLVAGPRTPKLSWNSTVGVAHAAHVAVAAGSTQPTSLFVLTADPSAQLVEVSTANHATLATQTLAGAGLALAASNDGANVYVVAEGASAGDPRRLLVFDASNLVGPPVQDLEIPASGGDEFELAVAPAPDRRLVGLRRTSGVVLIWGSDINGSGAPAPATEVNVGSPNLVGLAVGSDAKSAYTLDPSASLVHVVDLANLAMLPSIQLPASSDPVDLAVVRSSQADRLAVVNGTSSRLDLLKLSPADLVGSASVAHPPVGVVVGDDGSWAYVISQDGGRSFVQPVSLAALQSGASVPARDPLAVGHPTSEAVLTGGTTLYVPFVGVPAQPAAGGVAIVEVDESHCADFLTACPTCDGDDCMVVATVERYRPGDRLLAIEEPPSAPGADRAAIIARIDQRLGRRILPSVQALADAVQCLLESGTGGTGTQGPPGQNGADGADGADGVDGADGERGPKGDPGPGLEARLNRIVALSWKHNGDGPLVPIGGTDDLGIVIGFERPVLADRIDADHIFQVLLQLEEQEDAGRGVRCRCAALGKVVPVRFSVDPGDAQLIVAAGSVPGPDADGVAFLIPRGLLDLRVDPHRIAHPISKELISEFWVILRGDFVLDFGDGRAIAADFVRAELPTGYRPAGSGFGVQGGTFESWFLPLQPDQRRVNPNIADRTRLMAVRGIGRATADRILAERERGPFASPQDFKDRAGVPRAVWMRIRDLINFDD